MQKIILITATWLFLYLVTGAQNNTKNKDVYRENGAELPAMRVIDTAYQVYSEEKFRNGHYFFLFLFNPTCGHCIDMAKMVNDSIHYFQNNNILFLAGAQMMPYLESFYQATGLGKYPQITVGIDSAQTIELLYAYKTLPQINVYNENGRLENTFYGDTPLDSLKQYAR